MSRAHAAPRVQALVVGGGVSGLSCAVRLAEAGFAVELWERDAVERTVSSVAGAIWHPFAVGGNGERWSLATRLELLRLCRAGAPGVSARRGLELLPRDRERPRWLATMPAFRELAADELPAGAESGVELELPIVEMPPYLAWLRQRLKSAGARIARRAIAAFDEAFDHASLVVDASGLSARELCRDRELVPVRGQVVHVERQGVERFLIDDHNSAGLTYVVPRENDCVLGGTAERGSDSVEIDEATTRAIVARCSERLPALRGARVLGAAAGLRPWRPLIRCEAEVPRPGAVLIHDYGHGGSGLTASWGCADEVLALARAAASNVARRA